MQRWIYTISWGEYFQTISVHSPSRNFSIEEGLVVTRTKFSANFQKALLPKPNFIVHSCADRRKRLIKLKNLRLDMDKKFLVDWTNGPSPFVSSTKNLFGQQKNFLPTYSNRNSIRSIIFLSQCRLSARWMSFTIYILRLLSLSRPFFVCNSNVSTSS